MPSCAAVSAPSQSRRTACQVKCGGRFENGTVCVCSVSSCCSSSRNSGSCVTLGKALSHLCPSTYNRPTLYEKRDTAAVAWGSGSRCSARAGIHRGAGFGFALIACAGQGILFSNSAVILKFVRVHCVIHTSRSRRTGMFFFATCSISGM